MAGAIGLTGEDLTVDDVWAVAVEGATAELTDIARGRMRAARELVERAAHGTSEHTYGVNTGFGRFVAVAIPEEQELCAFWRNWEVELLRPRLIVTVGLLALKRQLGFTTLTPHIGVRYEQDGTVVIPLPHPSGASSWPSVPANKERLDRALALVRDELSTLSKLGIAET